MPGAYTYRVPPGWPEPPDGWEPPEGWRPDPSWPRAPSSWQFWQLATPPPPTNPAPAEPTVEPIPAATAALPQSVSPSGEVSNLRSLLESALTELEDARTQVQSLRAQLEARPAVVALTPGSSVVDLDDERVLQDVGIYAYRHPVQNSQEYRDQLVALTEQIKASIREGKAVLASEMFTFGGSLAKGRKMTGDLSKLMLRAFNAEADNAMRTMRAGNSVTAVKRLQAASESIARLGSMMEMRIDPAYQDLRIQEIELTQDFLMKVQQEKEQAREEREQLREERKAELELRAERERLDKERNHYLNVLKALQDSGDYDGATELQAKISGLDHAIAHNDYRTANIRAGYVYVISNVGAFGPNIVKIGMTRRLEPMDRVRELGDASVPFPFDVHALYFSNDAVTLETQLHQTFAESKVNYVNPRREFFFATPEQVRTVLADKVGNLLEFTEAPEATQYFQSKKYWHPTLPLSGSSELRV